MLKNYLTTALRALRRHLGYTVLNVAGLAVGTAVCLLIAMIIRHEWSYDRFHEHADRIYRTTITYEHPDGSPQYQNMMFPDFTPELEAAFPSIEHATRFVKGTLDFEVNNTFFQQTAVEVDPSFFEIFSFPLLAGDPAQALRDPSGMVITEAVAQRFFGVAPEDAADALGETVSVTSSDTTLAFTVTGVAAALPATSSLQFDVALSFENYDPIRLGGNNWGGRTSTYVLLADDTDAAAFEAALQPFVDTQFAEYQEQLRGNDYLAEGDDAFQMALQPLPEMHMSPDVWVPYETAPYDPLYAYILGGIGLLVLLIACINFMTLSVGLSAQRAREVGMRKVLGAHRWQVMQQFWGEALLLTGFSLLIGLALAQAVLPFFNTLTGASLSLGVFAWYEVVLVLGALLIIVGAVAGSYPAIVLSGYRPVTVFKGEVATRGNSVLTRSLVVVQYTISMVLIVGALVMTQQLQYLLTSDKGYDDDLVMVVHAGQVDRGDVPRVMVRFRNRLLSSDRVTHVARAGYSFTRGSDRNTWTDAGGTVRSAYNYGVDTDYVELMGMEIVEGRTFSPDRPSDSTQSVLVNQALVREFGLDDPVGAQLTGWLDWIYEEPPTIIGVVKDFHFQSLRQEVEPAVLNMHPDYYNLMGAILLKVRPGDLSGTISDVEATWNAALPGKPFSYSFLDDDLAAQYQTEQRWRTIVTYAAILAVLIACLGLFGLATLSVARRTKEVGIRKTLGASVPGLVALLSKTFARLVVLALVIAAPLAYVAMREWLDSFAYRIDLGVGVFLLAGGVTLAIALLTTSIQAVRAALRDPVQAIRQQ